MGGTGAADHSCKGTLYLGAIPVHCKIVGGGGGGMPSCSKSGGASAPCSYPSDIDSY